MSYNLAKQLKSIGSRPSQEWKDDTRQILLSRIFGDSKVEKASFESAGFLSRFAWQPVAVFACLALLVLGGSGVAVAIAQNSKPGDSLFVVKKGVENLKMAATKDHSRQVALANNMLDNRVQELNEVIETKLVSADSNSRDTVSLALIEVEKQIKDVNSRFSNLKNETDQGNNDMVAAAIEINRRMSGYKKELKQAQDKIGDNEKEVDTKISNVLAEAENITHDALSVIVEKHSTGEAQEIEESEIKSSLEEHIGEIGTKVAALDVRATELPNNIADKVTEAKQKIEEANKALAEDEYPLVLTLARDSSDILKLIYGEDFDVYEVINEDEENTTEAADREIKGAATSTVDIESDVSSPLNTSTAPAISAVDGSASPDAESTAEETGEIKTDIPEDEDQEYTVGIVE